MPDDQNQVEKPIPTTGLPQGKNSKRAPARRSRPKSGGGRFKRIVIAVVLFFLVSGSAFLKFGYDRTWEFFHTPKIVVIIIHPFIDPKNHNYEIQTIIIENIGRRNAENVRVTIPYSSSLGNENISVSCPDHIEEMNRENNQISFRIPMLPMNRRVVVALNASINTVRPNTVDGVDVFYNDGVLDPRNIIYW